MEQKNINPWEWQNNLGFSQAIEVTGAQRVLYCAGQTSISADGKPLHEGDVRAQRLPYRWLRCVVSVRVGDFSSDAFCLSDL